MKISSSGSRSHAPAARGNPRLPSEISFLVHYGVSPAILANAAAQAAALNVPADQALLAAGMVSAEHFYRSLARHLRVTFVDHPVPLDVAHSHAEAVRSGHAPFALGADHSFLVAPRGAMIPALLGMRRAGRANHFALTTPAYFSRLVRHAARAEIAQAASLDLHVADAELSAKGGANKAQIAVFTAAASLIAFFLPLAPYVTADACAALIALAFIAIFWLRLSACATRPVEVPAPLLNEGDLPLYSIVIALYREARVVSQLIAALEALSYPRAKLDVKLVIEEDDEETLRALTAAKMEPCCEIIRAPSGKPRTKPRALNVALPFLRGAYVAVYDAEDIPEPQQLLLAASRFAAAPQSLACLQARLAIDNTGDGWRARLFAIEYAGLFDVINPGLSALGLPFPLGGTSNHFRTAVLREIGGWDAWNVTEDADLGLRLARFGYASATLTSTTYEEAPVSITAFFRQRRRWCKGWYQTLIVLWRNPRRLLRELGMARGLLASLVVLANILGPLAAPFCCLCLGLDVFLGPAAMPANIFEDWLAALCAIVIVAGLPAMPWPALLGMKRRKLLRLWPTLFLLPAYVALICAAAWTAIYDLLAHPYRWLKTPHGLGRRERRPVPETARAAAQPSAELRAVRNFWLTFSDISR